MNKVYRHHKGGLYREVLRRPARTYLLEGERVWADLPGGGQVEALVTDKIMDRETFVVYTSLEDDKTYARPERQFDEPGRFTLVEDAQETPA